MLNIRKTSLYPRLSYFLVWIMVLLPQIVFGQGLVEPCKNPALIPGQEGCRDANILLLQLIRIAEYLFTIIGSLAFLMFVYGGFKFVISMGNAEKAKEGFGTMFQAAVGVVVALSAFLLVEFVLDAIGVQSDFRAL